MSYNNVVSGFAFELSVTSKVKKKVVRKMCSIVLNPVILITFNSIKHDIKVCD